MYDRRSWQDRTTEAVKFAAKLTASALSGGENTTDASDHDASDDDAYEVGDIVAMVDRISTRSKPHILLGKILRVYPRRREVLLAHLSPIPCTRNKYKLVVGRDSWIESFDALVYPVDVAYEEETSVYTLRTTPTEIHNSVL